MTRTNRTVTAACIVAVSSLALVAPGAAQAAGPGSEGRANALTATALGESGDSGTTRAFNDGTGEQRSGPTHPLPTVLSGQPYAGVGVLAQDAAAADDATSAACAGIAGDGGSADVVEVGDTDCLTPGDNLDLQLAELDLSALLDAEVATGAGSISTLLALLSSGQSEQLVGALQSGVDEVAAALGNAGLVLDAGAVESSCTYDREDAHGTTRLTDVGVDLVVPEVGETTLLTLETEPEPNQDVVVEIDDISALVVDDLQESLVANLDALDLGLAPLNDALDAAQADIVAQVVLQLRPALETVQAEVLDLVLNQQTPDGSSLAVTGLHAELAPGAAQFGAPELLTLDLADVGCGPMEVAPVGAGGTDSGAAPGGSTVTPTTDTAGNPVPTVVNAGTEGDQGTPLGALLAAVAAAAAAAGIGAAARARRTARG